MCVCVCVCVCVSQRKETASSMLPSLDSSPHIMLGPIQIVASLAGTCTTVRLLRDVKKLGEAHSKGKLVSFANLFIDRSDSIELYISDSNSSRSTTQLAMVSDAARVLSVSSGWLVNYKITELPSRDERNLFISEEQKPNSNLSESLGTN